MRFKRYGMLHAGVVLGGFRIIFHACGLSIKQEIYIYIFKNNITYQLLHIIIHALYVQPYPSEGLHEALEPSQSDRSPASHWAKKQRRTTFMLTFTTMDN